jgi:hypothetical protein
LSWYWWTTVRPIGTFPLLREIAAVDSRVTVVKLRRNFGQTAAPRCRLRPRSRVTTSSPWTAICSTIPPTSLCFSRKSAEGYDIVSGWRKHRVDNLWLRRIPSRIARTGSWPS